MDVEPMSILALPVDILQQILYHALFSGKALETVPIDTGVRNRNLVKVTPFDCRYPNKCLLATKPSILFSVCSTFYREGASILYKTILVDLHYSQDHERAALFFSTIGARSAALIRCMRLPLGIVDASLPRCVFADILNTIASDFVNLEKLILIYPVQEGEREFYAQAGLDEEHILTERIAAVQSVLGALSELRVEVEKAGGSTTPDGEHMRVPLVPYAGSRSLQQQIAIILPRMDSFISWSLLPEKIKHMVIRFTVLPPDRLLHPLLRMSAFPETRTLMPLLLTSKDTSRITQDVVYREATFMSCLRKDRGAMYAFFRKRTLQQLQKIERYNINGMDHWNDRRLLKFLKSHCPNAVDMEPSFRHTMGAHPCWDVHGKS